MSNNKKRLKKTTSCGALTYRVIGGNVQVCLIKQFQHKDAWGIPKGHLNDNETLEECAIREVKEETGLVVKLENRLQDIQTAHKGEDKTVVSFFAQQVGNEEPQCDDPDCEVADVRWFNTKELPRIHFYQQNLIEDAVRLLECLHGQRSEIDG